jgi:hypothetical protein
MASRLTAGEKMLRAITEAEFQQSIIAQARLLGWLVYWPPPNRPGGNGHVVSITAGWPDLVFLRNGDLFFAELKKETGKTSPEQDHWHAELRKAGMEVHVWRPSDRFEIDQRLRKL